jgi:DNA invertase Pin-like site-specific DNA recombinase
MAEDERERIVQRANDGRKAARARGTKFGRKARSIAKFLGVHHATVARVLYLEALASVS